MDVIGTEVNDLDRKRVVILNLMRIDENRIASVNIRVKVEIIFMQSELVSSVLFSKIMVKVDQVISKDQIIN